MFLIPTYIARSPIHGAGVFTPVDIPTGTRVWEFAPEVDWKLSPEELAAVPERLRRRLETYCYLNEEGLYVLCGDNARFMNHADAPNCDDSGGPFTVACRPIRATEELTCDYRVFDRRPTGGETKPLFSKFQ